MNTMLMQKVLLAELSLYSYLLQMKEQSEPSLELDARLTQSKAICHLLRSRISTELTPEPTPKNLPN